MSIAALKAAFEQGRLSKPDYIAQSYDSYHQILFEYSRNLSQTDIRHISIDADGVIFTVRSSGIRIRCQVGDHRSPRLKPSIFQTLNLGSHA